MFLSIEKNWTAIIQHLQLKKELNRINDIQLSHIREIITALEAFEEAFKKLEGGKTPSIHLVCIYAHHLKKKCISSPTDHELTKQLKEKLL